MYATESNSRTEYRNDKNDRGAIVTNDGHTVFGFWEQDAFRCAHSKPSKRYANPARAAAKWMAA